jgi:hypothetical protein
VEDEFRRGASIPIVSFPRDGAEIPDNLRLSLTVADPETEWSIAGSRPRYMMRTAQTWWSDSFRRFLCRSSSSCMRAPARLPHRIRRFGRILTFWQQLAEK